jgi:hypothetical protein
MHVTCCVMVGGAGSVLACSRLSAADGQHPSERYAEETRVHTVPRRKRKSTLRPAVTQHAQGDAAFCGPASPPGVCTGGQL